MGANLTILEARDFYSRNFMRFCTDIMKFKDIRVDPHLEICNFVTTTPGNGSNRSSNIPEIQFKNHPSRQVNKRRWAVLVPRATFKTSIVNVSYITWRLIHNPNLHILIASYNIDKSKEFLAEIKSHFENNDLLINLYGNMTSKKHGGRWSADQIQVYDPFTKKLAPFRNMASIRAVGTKTATAGLHPDIAILDDIVCYESTQSEDGLESGRSFLRMLEPMMEVGSEIGISGTRYDWNDAYQGVIDSNTYDVLLRSAINPDNSLYFPERLTYEVLKEQEHLMGTYMFSCQFLNNPVNPKDAIFKEDWIRDSLYETCPYPKDQLRISVWVDPAATANKRSDDTALLVVGMDKNEDLWILEAISRKIADQDMIDMMLDFYEKWDAEVLNCEQVAAFALIEPMVRRSAKDRGLNVNYNPIGSDTTKTKAFRIRSIMPLVQTLRIKIQENMTDLLSEMRRYQPNKVVQKDNLLDALSMACDFLVKPKERREPLDLPKVVAEKRREWEIDYGYEKRQRELEQGGSMTFHNMFSGVG